MCQNNIPKVIIAFMLEYRLTRNTILLTCETVVGLIYKHFSSKVVKINFIIYNDSSSSEPFRIYTHKLPVNQFTNWESIRRRPLLMLYGMGHNGYRT